MDHLTAAKRQAKKRRTWDLPSPEEWKAFRWSQDAGCPREPLSLQESIDLAQQVIGDPGGIGFLRK